MANIKFSAFTQKVASADVDFIVGYTGTDNIRIAPSVLDDRYVLKTGDTMTGALQMGASFAAQTPISFGDANFQISTENNYTAANLDNLKFKVPDAATGGFRFTNANDDEIFFAQGDGKIGVNTVTPQKTLDVSLGGNTGIGASFGGTISTGEYQGIHVGYSEAGNTKYRKSAIVFERDDSATGNAQGNIYILNNVENNDTSATLSDQRIKISKNTNVGIGEDLRPQYPEAKLTINSDPGNTSQPDRITTSVVDSHTGLFLNGTGNAINEKYGLQFGWYSGYSTGGIFVVGDNVAGSTSGDITFDMGDGVSGGALIERMRLTHEGSLGIGTISPLSNSSLDIFGTTGAKGRIATFTLQNSDDPTVAIADGKQTRPSISFSTDNTTGIFGGSGFVALGTSANERMRITSVGNVGIGTDSPTTTLQVGGLDDGNNYDITLGWDAVAGDAVGTKRSALTFKTSQNSVNQEDIYKWDIAMLAATATNGSENFGSDLAFLRSTRSSTDVDAVTMLLSRIGDVGIGTDSPLAKLDITTSGNTAIPALNTVPGTSTSAIFRNSGNTVILAAGVSNTNLAWLQARQTTGTGSAFNIALNPLGGDVGIGTASPGNFTGLSFSDPILDVNGIIQSRTGKIFLGGSDYRKAALFTSTGTAAPYLSFNVGSSGSSSSTSEAMRIDASGNLLVGTTSTLGGATDDFVTVANVDGGRGGIRIGNTGGSSNTSCMRFHNSNGVVGGIRTSGSATAYDTSSDYRLKEDLKDFDGLDKVSKIPVYDFKWKVDNSRSYGVLAHELQEVVPIAVNGKKDAEEMQGVDYSKIVPLLIKSIQELKAEVESLKNK